MQEREKFGSRIGFILVSAGCAVGLGNVWKFPYICGEYGGAAFIVIYLIFLLILGLPIMTCEFAVGRASRKSISNAFEELETDGTHWHNLKWAGMIGNYLLMMFYTMVGGWMLYYAYKMATNQLAGHDSTHITADFNNMLGSAGTMTFWMIITVVLSFGICVLGLQKGIEKITKIMMTVLIALMIVLAVHSVTLPNSAEGLKFFFVPDFDLIKQNGIGTAIFAAMTHAFFTLSVGMGTMEIFGSYIGKERSLLGEATSIMCLDTFVALMAGVIILPACFAYNVTPDAGPSLLFITLPNLFNHMAGGRIWGTLFFIFMSFAALSTVIAVFENILSFYMDMLGWERKKAVIVNIILVIALSFPAVLGYNILSGFHPMSSTSTIMDLEDFLVSYNILPLGSMVFVLFCVKNNGWGFDSFIKEANTGKGIKLPLWIKGYMTYILPLIIIVVYLKGYYDTFAPMGTAHLIGWMAFALVLLGAIFWIALRKPASQDNLEMAD